MQQILNRDCLLYLYQQKHNHRTTKMNDICIIYYGQLPFPSTVFIWYRGNVSLYNTWGLQCTVGECVHVSVTSKYCPCLIWGPALTRP